MVLLFSSKTIRFVCFSIKQQQQQPIRMEHFRTDQNSVLPNFALNFPIQEVELLARTVRIVLGTKQKKTFYQKGVQVSDCVRACLRSTTTTTTTTTPPHYIHLNAGVLCLVSSQARRRTNAGSCVRKLCSAKTKQSGRQTDRQTDRQTANSAKAVTFSVRLPVIQAHSLTHSLTERPTAKHKHHHVQSLFCSPRIRFVYRHSLTQCTHTPY